MFSGADKTVKQAFAAVQQRTTAAAFFRKAAEGESFFAPKQNAGFFGSPVQAKLTVSSPDDPQEKEADAVAEKVMRMPEPLAAAPETRGNKEEKLHRKEEEQVETKLQPAPAGHIQAKQEPAQLQAKACSCDAGDERTHVHKKTQADVAGTTEQTGRAAIALYPSDVKQESGRGPPMRSPPFEQTLASSKGAGTALPPSTRQFMESRFGADFSAVRIHTGAQAHHLSRSVQAQAFAHGADIYFNHGKYAPDSAEGKGLLAHELTHTIQQGAAKPLSSPAASTHVATTSVSRKARKPLSSPDAPAASSSLAASIQRSPATATLLQPKRISSPQADPAFLAQTTKVKATAQQAKKHPPAAKKAADAQSAAKPPANEKQSKAKDKQAEQLDQQQPDPFNEAAFKAALRQKIQALQLSTLQEAEDFKRSNKAASLKGDMASQVTSEKDHAAAPIDSKVKQEPPTASMQGKPVGPDPSPEKTPSSPSIDATQAAPKAVPAEDVSLNKESQSLDAQMKQAKVTDQQLARSNEPKFTSALDSKKQAQQDCHQRPGQFRKEEKALLNAAQLSAASTGKAGLAALAATHKQKAGGVLDKQQHAKAKDEADRAKVASDIEAKFNATKADVEALLSRLDTDAAALFDQGIAAATRLFEDYVDREVHHYKVERYLNRLGGSLLWAKDLLLGMPDEVNEIYVRGKQLYVSAMDKLIDQVAKLVVTQLNAAKKRINQGKQQIKGYVESLPKNLQQIGAEAARNIQAKFSELEQGVNSKQTELIDSLAAKYKAGLESVDKKMAEMKEANKGLVSKAVDAIREVIDAIIEFKNMLLNVLARAAAAIELIIEDPIGFLGNLVAGVKAGIQGFVSNIGQHLKAGLMGWLFGELGKAGIQMPASFDAKEIMSLVLQVLGLTYANIRSRAVAIVGEPVVKALETAAEVFIIIRNEGIAGLWRFIKEKVEQLKDAVLDGIKQFVIEKIVVAGVTWLVSMLNPASAFIKACKMIYDVIMFFVTRGSQIMALVNAVIDSVTAIAQGAIGVAAKAVENALAKALPVAISFLASLLGLGGISEKIKSIIARIQAPVNAAIDWVIHKAVALVKAAGKLLGGLGKGKGDKKKEEEHSPEKQAKIDAGVLFMKQEEARYLKEGKISKEDADKVAAAVKSNHAVFSSFTAKEVGTKIQFVYTASPLTVADEREADKPTLPDGFTVGTYIKAGDVFYQIGAIEKEVVEIRNAKTKVIRRQKMESAVKDIQDKKYVKATDDEIKELQESEFPEERKLPSVVNGDVLRDHYESFGWQSFSAGERSREVPNIVAEVQRVQALTDPAAQQTQWDNLKKKGWVAKGATPGHYNPSAQEYQTDHEPDLSLRWNNGGGRNGDDGYRKIQLTAPQTNVVEKAWNLSKSKHNYILSVQRGFSSAKLDSPPKSKTIKGQPYLDKNNQPLK
ncbi:MAG: DUF4157 domain-containing protein [Williamsia sp.]|nr:DUF4157 domain-containing protein [Williamsia sp.]